MISPCYFRRFAVQKLCFFYYAEKIIVILHRNEIGFCASIQNTPIGAKTIDIVLQLVYNIITEEHKPHKHSKGELL